jgi:lysophospholipase L1-like esterase
MAATVAKRWYRGFCLAGPGAFLVVSGQPAAAQVSPPAPPVIQPPGKGMIEQPCPAQAVPAMPKSEPGRPGAITREWGMAYSAAITYQQRHDWAWLCRYQTANEALKIAPPPRAVFMGDSITEAWGNYDPQLFRNGIVDRGISGQTTPQMLVRFYHDVVALRPRVVHIMAGTNDIAGNTGPTSAEQFMNNIRAMVDIALANRIAVVLASITPVGRDARTVAQRPPARILELNRWLRDYAAERGLTYADYYQAMAGPDNGVRDGLTYDGLHPGTTGYAVMRPIAERAVAQAERRGRPSRGR